MSQPSENWDPKCRWPSSKRVFDLAASSLLLVALTPILLLCSLLVWCSVGWPVFYRQVRPGKNAELFRMYKFRTMSDARDEQGKLLPDAQRTTAIGRFLRASSLDELPELLNVLRGEMSLVGPRPLLVRYLSRYTPQQARRHEVLPGITGLAQIKGRILLNWEERFRLDVWYVDNHNLLLDLKILALTVWKVLSRDGMKADGGTDQGEFWGLENKPEGSPNSAPVEEDERVRERQ